MPPRSGLFGHHRFPQEDRSEAGTLCPQERQHPADAGHGNYKAADFIAANYNQDGGDIRILADVNPKAKLIIAQSDVDILLNNESFNSFGVSIENNIFEAAGTINNGTTHWVNIIGISSYDKMSWFGGEISHHYAFKIWNPIGGITSWINSSGITNLRIFKY